MFTVLQKMKIKTRLVDEQPPSNVQPDDIGGVGSVPLTANHNRITHRPISLGKNPYAL